MKPTFSVILIFICFVLHAQNLVPFRANNEKWGFKNKAGKIVLPAIYDDAAEFSDGVAAVAIRKKFQYVIIKNLFGGLLMQQAN
jgi:hypothetical protein